jgi:hypothetical protein
VKVGRLLVQTVRHFFPKLNDWLQGLPDTRDRDLLIYETRFLAWWGILLYLLQLGSRRQLDFQLDAQGSYVLANLNRLAGTEQHTRPVHGTLDHFLEHVPSAAIGQVRTRMVQHLIRNKVLEPARLAGHLVMLLDATGLFYFRQRHCDS